MKETVIQVAIESIELRQQIRTDFDEEKIAGLARNIEAVGLEHPVSLFADGDKFGITDGERRCRAFKLLGRRTIPAIVKEKPSEVELLFRQCSCDLQREDLSPMERASAIAALMAATGLPAKDVAAKLGTSPAMITRLAALLTLPEEIQIEVRRGRIAASAAYELSKIGCTNMQLELARKLMDGKMTRDGVAGARKAGKGGKGDTPVKRVTACLEGGRTVTVSATTLDDFIAALEEVLPTAKKSRTQGLALDTFLRLLKDRHEATGCQ